MVLLPIVRGFPFVERTGIRWLLLLLREIESAPGLLPVQLRGEVQGAIQDVLVALASVLVHLQSVEFEFWIAFLWRGLRDMLRFVPAILGQVVVIVTVAKHEGRVSALARLATLHSADILR